MDISKNILTLNNFFAINQLTIKDRLRVINIAKVSVDIDDLFDNLKWENPSENIKINLRN